MLSNFNFANFMAEKWFLKKWFHLIIGEDERIFTFIDFLKNIIFP